MHHSTANSPQTIAIDLEARPVDWEFAPGQRISGYGFNDRVPGPTIEGRVGDTLVIRLKNSLPEPTTIHWHGLRVPAEMDGTERVQSPVMPGETFEYRFVLPDAGTFWYHPHTHETMQLEMGLYGAMVVRGHDEPTVDREQVLVLDDLKLDDEGNLAEFGGLTERHEGRLGEVFLVNGRAGSELNMNAGQVERWRIINSSSSRYALLSIGGRQFTILATDGGLLSAPVPATEVLLTPGDRVDIAVGPFEEGEALPVESLPYSRGMIKEKSATYATLRVSTPAPSRAAIPEMMRHIHPLAGSDAAVTRTVELSGQSSPHHGVEWQINRMAHHNDQPVMVGDLQVWDVVNKSDMDHPFHLHGFFFQVVEVNRNPPGFISWEDTVNVPAKGSVRIVWLPDDRPGAWMYHCHILEHHAAGMMAHFDVIPAGADAAAHAPAESHHGHH
jgi:FtsP/CotA-like multicopper oxidase with cupredoxin domain